MEERLIWVIGSIVLVLIIFSFLFLFVTGKLSLPNIITTPVLFFKKKGTIPYNIIVAVFIGIASIVAVIALLIFAGPEIMKFASDITHGILG